MGAPLFIIQTDLAPRADRGSSFLFLIRAYMSLLNFVVISARREHLLIFIQVSTKGATLTSLTLTLFSFNFYDMQHVGGWVRTQAIEHKSPQIYKIVPTFNRLGVFYRFFNTTLVLAFEFRSSLNCTKKKGGYGRPIKPNKNQQMMRSIDAPKFGVPYRWSNLEISPQTSLAGVSKSSPDTKKKRVFQYLKDEGKPLTILDLLAQGTSS